MKEDLDYWKKRCELAEDFIEEHPCDPDITDEQTEAYNNWCEFKKLPIPKKMEVTEEQNNFIGDVSISLFDNLNNSIKKYVELFEKKHEIELDFWVANFVGTIGCFSNEYYIDFETIRLDLEKDVPKDVFFNWYDLTLDLGMRNEPIINYYSYLKGVRLN